MGRLLLAARLAARDLRRRPGEAALLVLAIAAAATTLTLGLVLRDVSADPYQRTRQATAGPDVVADASSGDLADMESLIDADGVAAHSGPFPVALVDVAADGGQTGVAHVVGRDAEPADVDRPHLTDGSWVAGGDVVIEAAFAEAIGLAVGDRITLDDRSFDVAGIAITAAVAPYPDAACLGGSCVGGAGLVWLARADAEALAATAGNSGYVLNLALDDPDAAPAFLAAHSRDLPLASWRDILEQVDNAVGNQRNVLVTGGWLLGVLAVASVAVLVGGRLAGQTARVGLLKAVGATPLLVGATLLAEYVVLAVGAAAIGLAVGWLAAPLLIEPSAGLIGSTGTPSLTASTAGFVVAVAVAVALTATLLPVLAATRTSTVAALAGAARPPRRTSWLIAASTRLPIALLLGLRIAGRRPRRTMLGVASVLVTVSGIVAVLGARVDVAASNATPEARRAFEEVLTTVSVALVALAAVNAVVITAATIVDHRGFAALAAALGATPRQVSLGMAAAQVLPALAGAVLAIPGGLGLLAAADPDSSTPVPPAWHLAAVVPVVAVVLAALAAIPAVLGSRRQAAEALAAERG